MQGQADIVLFRSPFGKLVHEYVGFQNTVGINHVETDIVLKARNVDAASEVDVGVPVKWYIGGALLFRIGVIVLEFRAIANGPV